ncbi:MAG: peptidase [Nitrospirota bacterium]
MTSVFRNIFRINLAVKKNERVLIFNDRIPPKKQVGRDDRERMMKLRCLSLLASETGKNLCKSIIVHEYLATGGHGIEPPVELWELAFGRQTIEDLKKERILHPILRKTATDDQIRIAEQIIKKNRRFSVDCVIALANFSTSHTRFRDFLTRICACRYASMPLFDISMLEGAMNVDWKALEKRTKGIAKIVSMAEFVEVKSSNGSHLSFSKKERKALSDTGILTKPGSFGNLPAGEVFLAPVEGTACGKLILEWAPTRHLECPVTLTVNDGFVTDISGKERYAGYLRGKISERRENGNIAELGIGTNEAARRPDNILESEKILGTIHIALGDNSSFGGNVKTPFHEDFVFFKPTVTLINKDGSRKDILKVGRVMY